MEFLIELLLHLFLNVPILRTVALTIVPALLLLWYVRKKDRLEPEPKKLIWSLVGLGALSTLLAVLLELGGLAVLTKIADPDSLVFCVLHWFLIVGLAEEASKYLMLRLRTWKNPNFDCLFDGMVYAVAVSAGFALLENVMYLIRYGSSVVFIRAIVSIPAHICFSIFMGAWYSAAKKYETWNEKDKMRRCRVLAVVIPAIAHGLFDMIASRAETGGGILLFAAFVIAMFVVSWRMLKKLSGKDAFFRTRQEPDGGRKNPDEAG